jgi:hypothetical protein
MDDRNMGGWAGKLMARKYETVCVHILAINIPA